MTLAADVGGQRAALSAQFGRASAPRCPQRSHCSLGPNDGTGTSSAIPTTSKTVW